VGKTNICLGFSTNELISLLIMRINETQRASALGSPKTAPFLSKVEGTDIVVKVGKV